MSEGPALAARAIRACLVGDGRSIHVRRWARDLAQAGCTVAILSYGPAPPLPGVEVHRVRPAPPLLRQVISARDARGFLKRFAPDIVHLHYLPYGPRALWPLGIGRLILTPYGTDVEAPPPGWRGWLARRTIARLLGRADALAPASAHLLDLTRRWGRLRPGTPIEVIGFGVDCNRFRPRRR